MAKARKLPSGNWRAQVYDYTDQQGKRHYASFTSETKKETEYMAAEFAINRKAKTNQTCMTVQEAINAYCELKSNVLSQTTLKAYKSMQYHSFTAIENLPLNKLTTAVLQKWINQLVLNHSPKTVHNISGLLSAVLDTYLPDITYKISLPQKKRPDLYVPSDSDIKTLMDYYGRYDKDMLIAVCLAAFGTLRRSEICALNSDDVKGCNIYIDKAMVKNLDNKWIIKTTKTFSSTRIVEMPEFVIKMLPDSGRLININPSNITDRFAHTLKKLSLPHFRFHDLRHYAASLMHAIGIPDVYIMQRGGWSSDFTLKQIYRGAIADYQRKYTDRLIDYFSDMQHEMQHKK